VGGCGDGMRRIVPIGFGSGRVWESESESESDEESMDGQPRLT